MNYIKHLPINDTPEIFGLHDNANITFAQNETFSLLNGILKLQPKSAVGAGKSREEVKIEYVFFSLFFLIMCKLISSVNRINTISMEHSSQSENFQVGKIS